MLCVTVDIWQQRRGRIDCVNSWLKKANSSPEAEMIQAAVVTFSYVSYHSKGFRSTTPWHAWLHWSHHLTT